MNNVNHMIANRRENDRDLPVPFTIILKFSRQDIIMTV